MTTFDKVWLGMSGVLMLLLAIAWLALVRQLVQHFWREDLIPWLDRRAKSKRLIDDAVRHQHQKMLHQAVRRLVEEDRQRRPAVIAKLEEQQ